MTKRKHSNFGFTALNCWLGSSSAIFRKFWPRIVFTSLLLADNWSFSLVFTYCAKMVLWSNKRCFVTMTVWHFAVHYIFLYKWIIQQLSKLISFNRILLLFYVILQVPTLLVFAFNFLKYMCTLCKLKVIT